MVWLLLWPWFSENQARYLTQATTFCVTNHGSSTSTASVQDRPFTSIASLHKMVNNVTTSVLHSLSLSLLFLSLKGKHTNKLSLRFVDPELETRFSVEKEKQSGAAFCCSCVVLLFTAVMEALIDPWWVHRSVLLIHILGRMVYVTYSPKNKRKWKQK